METLLLQQKTSRNNYYVNLYLGEVNYDNRKLFIPFYSNDYNSELDAKKAAIRKFLSTNGGCEFYDKVTLTENIGWKIADKNEPYKTKSAIVNLLAIKDVVL